MDADVYSDKSDTSNNPDALVGELRDPEVVVNIGTIAAKVAYHNFEWRFVTLVMYNTLLHIGVDQFVQVYNRSVALKLGKFIPRHRVHVPQFVLFGQNTVELAESVQWLVQNSYDNTAKYIIACSSANYDKCSETDMFKIFSRLYMPNVIFLKAPVSGNDPLIFTYFPVLPGQCSNSKPSLIELSDCSNELCFKSLYPEKYGNMQKCDFVVSTLEQPPFMHLTKDVNGTLEPSGADGDILKLVSELLNATLIIKTAETNEWGQYKDNNWTGSLGDVFNKRAHASLCSAPLSPQIYGNFQISFTYATIDIVWASRLPALKTSFEKLVYPLKPQTRMALFIMFLIIAFFDSLKKIQFWGNVRSALNIGHTDFSLLFYSWLVFLGLPLIKLPTKTILRNLLSSWIWFSLVIRTAYQAALVSTMKVQLYEEYFKTFDEVIKNKHPFGGLDSLRDYYHEDKEVFSNWVSIKFGDMYVFIDKILDGSSDFVIALNKEFMIHNIMKYNGTKRLQMIPEKIVNSPAVLYFKKFAPMRAPITHILWNIVEGGLVDMIYSRYLNRGDYLFRHENHKSIGSLTLTQVSSSLLLLVIGWSLSFLYFIVEILSKKFERKDRSRMIV